MTKIPSVEQPRCKKLVENGKAVCNCILNCHMHDWRQKDYTIALLTELSEWTDNYLKSVNKYARHCHKENLTMLAYDAHSRKIATGHFKAHLDKLIKSTIV